MRSFLAVLVTFSLTAAATASPAMLSRAEPSGVNAERSFSAFASNWMSKAQARGERASGAPTARVGSAGMVFTYRAVDESFETELQPTGRPGSPYVGVLRYTEHTYTCADVLGEDCRVTSSLPLFEVFRFREGRWGY